MEDAGFTDNLYIKYTAFSTYLARMTHTHWKSEDDGKLIATGIHQGAADLSDPINILFKPI